VAYLFLFYCRGVLAGRGFFFHRGFLFIWVVVERGAGHGEGREWLDLEGGCMIKEDPRGRFFLFGGKSEMWVVMVVDSGWW